MALRRRLRKKITTKVGKGQDKKEKAEEKETRKRNEGARRLAQESKRWLKGDEEEKRRDEQEAARKEEEVARIEEEERKRKMDEELRKKEAERLKLTEQQASDPVEIQVQDVGNPDVQEPKAAASSTLGQAVVPTLRLIPFEQNKGEEVPDFNTIFYDRERKRIVKRTERKVEIGGAVR